MVGAHMIQPQSAQGGACSWWGVSNVFYITDSTSKAQINETKTGRRAVLPLV